MKPKHILFGVLALIAASCSNDKMSEVADMRQNGIQVTAGLTANTRVNFEQDGSVTHALWEEGDQITLYAPSQGYLTYQVSTLSEDATSATFMPINDALQRTDETIYAAYRAGMEADIVDGMATLPNTDMWTDEHPLPFAYAIGKVADGKLNLSFEHIFAYLKLTLNAETVDGSNVKKVTNVYLTNPSGTPVSIAAGRFDFSTQSIIEDKGIKEINYSLSEPFTATGTTEKSIYIPILPQPAGETIKLAVLHIHEAGCDTLFTVSKEVPSTGFMAGRAYTYSPKSSITKAGNTLTLTEAGTLSQAISAAEKDTITSLKLVGPLNGDDIRFIREMAGRDVNGNETSGKLTYLDISEASIVTGGDYYYLGEGQYQYWAYDNNLGQYMFSSTILNRILLPESITSISDCAFNACASLTDITIPDGVTRIGGHTFRDCTKLSDVKIGNNVTEIGYAAFLGCHSLANINIPNSVTSIADFAFSECTSLKNITIPNNVTMIGMSAFQMSALTSIDLPDNITSIAEQTFYGCSSLTTIEIPEGVTTIGRIAFNGCQSLEKVTSLAVTPPTLGDGVFSGIASSATLNVPSGTYAAYMASDWAQYFTTITDGEDHGSYENGIATVVTAGTLSSLIPEDEKYTITTLKVVGPLNGDDIRFIREMAGCDVDGIETEGKLVDLDISEATIVEGGDLYYNDSANLGVCFTENNVLGNFMFCSTKLERIVPPTNITAIGNYAFRFCESLTDVVIPETVTSLGDYAFSFCSKLTNIVLPKSITSIGFEAFSACSLLNNIIIPESVTTIGDYAFSDCHAFTNITIPDNVTSIGAYTFQRCYNLSVVNIGSGITSIGAYAFYQCSGLQEIVIPSGITLIENSAFQLCTSLSNVEFSDGLVSIGESTFAGCTSLSEITIPSGVASIGHSSFAGCKALDNVTSLATTPPILGNYAFGDIPTTATLYIPSGTYAAYMASDWAQYFTTIDGGKEHSGNYENGVATVVTAGSLSTLIPEEKKYTITTLKVVGPLNGDDIRFIREMAGRDAEGTNQGNATDGKLVDLDMSEATIVAGGGKYHPVGYCTANNIVGSHMFSLTILEKIVLPKNITLIDDAALSFCYELTSVMIGNAVTSIGGNAFNGCSSLVSVNLPNTLTWIAGSVFRGCSSLISINIPDGITMISDYAFENCKSLTSINIPEDVTSIGYGSFKNCSSLTSITIPDGVTEIGGQAFNGCSSLTSINIPDGIIEIGLRAFYGCSSLAEVTCNSLTPPTLGTSTFSGISSPSTLIIPAGCTTVYSESDWAQYFTTIEETTR